MNYHDPRALVKAMDVPLYARWEHLQGPDDVLIERYKAATSGEQRALGYAVEGALRLVRGAGLDWKGKPHALRSLCWVVDQCDIRQAYIELLAIAKRGSFGGDVGGIDPGVEPFVLSALATVQQSHVLYEQWLKLWKRHVPSLWPVVTAGLRFSDGERAVEILPRALLRGRTHKEFPLGEVLWAFLTSYNQPAAEKAQAALRALSQEEQAQARTALEQVGAEQEELLSWFGPSAPAAP